MNNLLGLFGVNRTTDRIPNASIRALRDGDVTEKVNGRINGNVLR